jgi:hypothetical protein
LECPSAACLKSFQTGWLREERYCPHCRKILADGAPVAPQRRKLGFIERMTPGRSALSEVRYQAACADFTILYESWRAESFGEQPEIGNNWLDLDYQVVRDRHARLLQKFDADIEEYCQATQGLAKSERGQAWKADRARRDLTDKLLAGMVGGSDQQYSEGVLARCSSLLPNEYSWDYLAAGLERRATQLRAAAGGFE